MKTLADKIACFEHAPYVYAYPPTRLYTPIESFSLETPIFTPNLNIYIHIPFCEQKCTFCGYLTTIDRKGKLQDDYVDCVVKEIGMHRELLHGENITSINFGGGTPSLLTVEQFAKIMNALIEGNSAILSTASEVSIEATPESIQEGKTDAFKDFGINRVSVGIQTLNDREISHSRRRNLAETSVRSVAILKEIGIPNVCCDLMYGLSGQTLTSWSDSVEAIVKLRPETIELYSTVVIPGTPLARLKKIQGMDNKDRLECYNLARAVFLEAGYAQDCHLRFIAPGKGGYFQQENVFAGESLLGFGAGAKSYAVNMHYRNSYDNKNHRVAIKEYIQNIQQGKLAAESAVTLSKEEQMRRFAIYNLEHLNKAAFSVQFGAMFEDVFPEEYDNMLALGLAEDDGTTICFTPKGFSFRDLVVKEFFSQTAKGQENSYWVGTTSK